MNFLKNLLKINQFGPLVKLIYVYILTNKMVSYTLSCNQTSHLIFYTQLHSKHKLTT